MSLQFRGGERTAEGARRIVRKHLGKALRSLEAEASESNIDGAVHEARKRIKKARAVLRLAGHPFARRKARRSGLSVR